MLRDEKLRFKPTKSSLNSLHRNKDLNGRLARWAITLQDYSYGIIHKKRSKY